VQELVRNKLQADVQRCQVLGVKEEGLITAPGLFPTANSLFLIPSFE